MTSRLPGAVVIGGYVNGLGAVRALARAGIRTAVVLTRQFDLAHRSRYVAEVHRVPDLHESPDGLLELLYRQREHWRGWLLLPTNDHALRALSEQRDYLDQWYPPAVPEIAIAERVLNKAATYRLAEEVGIGVPRSYGPARELVAAQQGVRFPVVVKPLEGAPFAEVFGTKLLVAVDPAELKAAVARVEASGLAAEIFDLIPGPDRNIHTYSVYLDRRGNPAAEFTFRKLRQSPPFYGVARAAETMDLPALREPSLELLRRIGWRGVASVEYKFDPRDGTYRLMEVNGRLFLTHGLAAHAGISYPLLTWQEHVAGIQPHAERNGWRGYWLHLHADLFYSAVQKRGADWSWGEWARSYRGPWIDAVWTPSDPAPFLAQWGTTLRMAMHAREWATIRARLQPQPHTPPPQRPARSD